MPTTPTGPLTVPLVAVRTAVVGAAAFATWVGPSVSPASRGYLVEEPQNDAGDKFVVVDWGFDCNRVATDIAAAATLEQSGSILVAFRSVIPAGTTDEEATIQFLNFLGAVLPQYETALRVAGIAVTANRLISGPERPDYEDRKRRDVYESIFQLEAKAWPE